MFGSRVDEYEAARPGYPDQLFEDVLAFTGDCSGVVEVGAGTGKATVALGRRGVARVNSKSFCGVLVFVC